MPDAVAPPAPLFLLRGVTRTFRMGEVEVPVLRGIDLEIPRGSLTVLLGPSGSGKTTLLNVIGGIDRPDEGSAIFDSGESAAFDLAALDDKALTRYRREHVGYVFQFYNLIPTLTALENVLVSTEVVETTVDPARTLEMVGLADRVDHFPAQLSGGEQQRVAIARALAKDPDLLLCDEPTGALDLPTGRKVLGLLRTVCDDLGKTVVIVTHNSAIAALAERVVRLGSGVIDGVVDGTPVPPEEITW